MTAPAIQAIGSITLGAVSSSVTFSNIPQTYRDLVLSISVRSDSASLPYAQCRVQFNGDTGSNYPFVEMTGNGSSSGSYSASPTEIFISFSAPSSSGAGIFISSISNIFDYASIDKHKTMITRDGSTESGGNLRAQAARWANTNAITSMRIHPATGYGNFATGSTFMLYGVLA